jgi:hypothetical protein
VQEQRVGPEIVCLSAKASEGIYKMGAKREAHDTLQVQRKGKGGLTNESSCRRQTARRRREKQVGVQSESRKYTLEA